MDLYRSKPNWYLFDLWGSLLFLALSNLLAPTILSRMTVEKNRNCLICQSQDTSNRIPMKDTIKVCFLVFSYLISILIFFKTSIKAQARRKRDTKVQLQLSQWLQ